jgi:uncharacterized protein (DUF362 family)
MDGLRGMANGPQPSWTGGDYNTDAKNMRLIMASSDATAMDTIQALVMGCDPSQVAYLDMVSGQGMGENDPDAIEVVGKAISEVMEPLEGSYACPGPA